MFSHHISDLLDTGLDGVFTHVAETIGKGNFQKVSAQEFQLMADSGRFSVASAAGIRVMMASRLITSVGRHFLCYR